MLKFDPILTNEKGKKGYEIHKEKLQNERGYLTSTIFCKNRKNCLSSQSYILAIVSRKV